MDFALTLNTQAIFSVSQGDYQEALEYFDEAFTVLMEIYPSLSTTAKPAFAIYTEKVKQGERQHFPSCNQAVEYFDKLVDLAIDERSLNSKISALVLASTIKFNQASTYHLRYLLRSTEPDFQEAQTSYSKSLELLTLSGEASIDVNVLVLGLVNNMAHLNALVFDSLGTYVFLERLRVILVLLEDTIPVDDRVFFKLSLMMAHEIVLTAAAAA